MNMLAHNFQTTAAHAYARIELTVPVYLHGTYIADSTAEVLFCRDETERDGFRIEEMKVHDLRRAHPPCIVTDHDRDEASRDMAYEVMREFCSDVSLRRAEEAMQEAEYEA